MLPAEELINLLVGPNPATPDRTAAATKIAAYLRHDTKVIPDGACLALARSMKGFLVPEIHPYLHRLIDSDAPGRALARRFAVAKKIVQEISFHFLIGAQLFGVFDRVAGARMGSNAKGEIVIDSLVFARVRKELIERLIDVKHDFIFGPRSSCGCIVLESGYPAVIELLDGCIDPDVLATLKLLPITAGAVLDDYDFAVVSRKVKACVVDVIGEIAVMFPATS
jgi:hypothetical protein